MCIEVRVNRFCANLSILEYPSLLPLETISPALESLSAVLGNVGATKVESPVGEELQYVEKEFPNNHALMSLIRDIREEDARKWKMVEEQEFEKAVRHVDRQVELMDRLYELCMSMGVE